MIPKIIHYCWFGRNKMPKLAKKCIKSWHKYCKDYQIIRWDESNFDINQSPQYVREAYNAKKWAFVTDYVRLWVIYNYGGIYLDTDVELIKSPGFLLKNNAFFGFEDFVKDNKMFLATGLGFGAIKGIPLIKDIMMEYNHVHFYKNNGKYDLTPCPERNSSHFIKYGFRLDGSFQRIDEILLLPVEYLCPVNWVSKEIKITSKTISIHHFAASWHNNKNKKPILLRIINKIKRILNVWMRKK